MSKKKMPRLQEIYRNEIRGKLQERFNYANPMEIPNITKVVLNMGLGKEAIDNANNVTNAQGQMEAIAGRSVLFQKLEFLLPLSDFVRKCLLEFLQLLGVTACGNFLIG